MTARVAAENLYSELAPFMDLEGKASYVGLITPITKHIELFGKSERLRALEEAAKLLETYGLQMFREVENYPVSRGGAMLASFAVYIRALKDEAKS